nr:transposase [Streptomyces inhibens]
MVDDVWFPKCGTVSVGVGPASTAARWASRQNCQVAVSVHAVTDTTASCPLE